MSECASAGGVDTNTSTVSLSACVCIYVCERERSARKCIDAVLKFEKMFACTCMGYLDGAVQGIINYIDHTNAFRTSL